MEISIFDVIGNGISNEELSEIIQNKLQDKYKKEFIQNDIEVLVKIKL